ncbi:MAG: nicotinate-nucleotide adenylyltransferase, partial [Pseudomonadota bacterium]
MIEAPRIAVLGGTFDPVHLGHLQFAKSLRDGLSTDEIACQVRMIPCHIPPHRGTPVATAAQRQEMLELALVDVGGVVLDDRELRLDRTSYSVDTLADLRTEFPDAALCLAVGMDAYAGFESWHRWRDILELASLVVATRPGFDLDLDESSLCERHVQLGEISGPGDIAFLPIP